MLLKSMVTMWQAKSGTWTLSIINPKLFLFCFVSLKNTNVITRRTIIPEYQLFEISRSYIFQFSLLRNRADENWKRLIGEYWRGLLWTVQLCVRLLLWLSRSRAKVTLCDLEPCDSHILFTQNWKIIGL